MMLLGITPNCQSHLLTPSESWVVNIQCTKPIPTAHKAIDASPAACPPHQSYRKMWYNQRHDKIGFHYPFTPRLSRLPRLQDHLDSPVAQEHRKPANCFCRCKTAADTRTRPCINEVVQDAGGKREGKLRSTSDRKVELADVPMLNAVKASATPSVVS